MCSDYLHFDRFMTETQGLEVDLQQIHLRRQGRFSLRGNLLHVYISYGLVTYSCAMLHDNRFIYVSSCSSVGPDFDVFCQGFGRWTQGRCSECRIIQGCACAFFGPGPWLENSKLRVGGMAQICERGVFHFYSENFQDWPCMRSFRVACAWCEHES